MSSSWTTASSAQGFSVYSGNTAEGQEFRRERWWPDILAGLPVDVSYFSRREANDLTLTYAGVSSWEAICHIFRLRAKAYLI